VLERIVDESISRYDLLYSPEDPIIESNTRIFCSSQCYISNLIFEERVNNEIE